MDPVWLKYPHYFLSIHLKLAGIKYSPEDFEIATDKETVKRHDELWKLICENYTPKS